MLSNQIDTKSLELVIYHQFNNIKLSFFASDMKSSFSLCTFNRCCTVIRYSRVSDMIFCRSFSRESTKNSHFLDWRWRRRISWSNPIFQIPRSKIAKVQIWRTAAGKEEKVPNVSTTLNKFAIFAQYCKGSKRIPFILVLHKVKVGICIAMPRDNKKSRFWV